ncbi:hypothetical protein MKQ68_10445 [Chitinophaga horti]|uniref:Alpha/beta hydrolase n=1 Tax=Chitinophaga horti TaxID=2920382 RepID=A0ABY6JB28_9BACT|nr:hypothetical protein [Chitinophaga horti]UYQ95519.1 hypothetical protein MKQ68_10445 [Chitinophaga horti]
MRIPVFLMLLVCCFSCTRINKLYVKYGEARQTLQSYQDSVIRIYMDRKGLIYPNIPLSDQLIRTNDSRLELLYANDENILQQAATAAGVPGQEDKWIIQDALAKQIAREIRGAAQGKTLVYLIHGFNKHPLRPDKSSAYAENKEMRAKMMEVYPDRRFQFVEIYWDGCTWANGWAPLAAFNSMKIWDNAQPASNNVGVELRRILNATGVAQNYVITHSLGASVATCALFNAEKFAEGDFMTGIRSRYNDTMNYRTPTGQYRLGIIAPAIPGENTFGEFFDRTPKGSDTTNVKVIVGFNQYDPVLRKYVNLSAYAGATTLGCRPSELAQVKRQVNSASATYLYDVDFSLTAKDKKQAVHAFSAYVKNEKAMNSFLEQLFHL